jgi:hypothetical protein
MPFVEMDPELARKAIEGYQNELEPERLGLEAFYRQFRCKRCGGYCQKELVSGHVFGDPGVLVPRAVLRCARCGFLFDPHSGLILEMGNPAKVPPDIPIVGSRDG